MAKKYRDTEKNKNRIFLRKFGISLNQYKEMFDDQFGVCAVCGSGPTTKKSLSVDHNHKTGKVRGLLCGNCNTAIGLFKENLNLLISSYEYLNYHERKL